MRQKRGLDYQEEGGSGGDEKWLDSVLILKVVVPTGFSDGSDERMREKEELRIIEHFWHE